MPSFTEQLWFAFEKRTVPVWWTYRESFGEASHFTWKDQGTNKSQASTFDEKV